VTKRKKSSAPAPADHVDPGSITTESAAPVDMPEPEEAPPAESATPREGHPSEPTMVSAAEPVPPPLAKTKGKRRGQAATDAGAPEASEVPLRESERSMLDALGDVETTVNVTGDLLPFPGRDDLDEPTLTVEGEALQEVDSLLVQRKHLRGLLEALVFASDGPLKTNELAKLASAPQKTVKDVLADLHHEYASRGIHLEEVAGGWIFRTSAQYAPFVRDLTKQKPVRLTRAQVETLAIIAYRQPVTRPEIDDVRGVDSGPVLKLLLERELVRILGKRDEPGRPLIYGTTTHFLEFFGLKSLKDLPTLREFTELTEESRDKYEDEIGEAPNDAPPPPREAFEEREGEAASAAGGELDLAATDDHPVHAATFAEESYAIEDEASPRTDSEIVPAPDREDREDRDEPTGEDVE
jgi:segregation and condensation protein B